MRDSADDTQPVASSHEAARTALCTATVRISSMARCRVAKTQGFESEGSEGRTKRAMKQLESNGQECEHDELETITTERLRGCRTERRARPGALRPKKKKCARVSVLLHLSVCRRRRTERCLLSGGGWTGGARACASRCASARSGGACCKS